MKNSSFLIVICFLSFSTLRCGIFTSEESQKQDLQNEDYLTQHWVRSMEEEPDESEFEIYRPDNYKEFPISWFRMQYIFEDNGECQWFYLHPSDRHHFKPGTWEFDDTKKGVLHIDKGDEIISYQIEELTNELLRMRPIATARTSN